MDCKFGDYVNHDLAEYHIATNADLGEIDVAWIEEHDPYVNPLGAKGIGEIGNERKKKRKVVARKHERIANRRKNFIEQEVYKLVARFGFLAIEALVVRHMVKNPKLAKSIADASWSQFFMRLQAKAEEAGRQVVKVNPASTSQTCSACGHRQPMPLSVRVYECPHCGLVIHRDHNGSLNILASARQAMGRHSRVIPEAPGL